MLYASVMNKAETQCSITHNATLRAIQHTTALDRAVTLCNIAGIIIHAVVFERIDTRWNTARNTTLNGIGYGRHCVRLIAGITTRNGIGQDCHAVHRVDTLLPSICCLLGTKFVITETFVGPKANCIIA